MLIKNDCLLKALRREPAHRTPLWMMRQAGRYLPEYRALRQKVPDFLTFCKTPDLTIEATLQPLRRFDLDAAIIFSDILVIPSAMGMDLQFIAQEGPCFTHPIQTEKEISHLKQVDPAVDLKFVLEAIQGVKKELSVPLIGFAGSPWTVATYMVEGKSSKNFQAIKTLLYRSPQVLHNLLKKITQATVDYVNAQIQAGVDVIMLFDTWGGVLSKADYCDFSLYYLQAIAEQLIHLPHQKIPVIFFTKGGGQWLELIAEKGCDAIGLDWTVDVVEAYARVGNRVALQGNIDPFVLFGTPQLIRKKVETLLAQVNQRPGYIFNLGHGIDQHTPIENVEYMINTIREYWR